MENEKELAERVLTRPEPPKGTYLMPYTTDEQLIKDVAFKWQTMTHILTLTHEAGRVPIMHTWRIRDAKLTRTYTTTHYAAKYHAAPTISNEKEYLTFEIAWAFIDGCYAYVKPMLITAKGEIE